MIDEICIEDVNIGKPNMADMKHIMEQPPDFDESNPPTPEINIINDNQKDNNLEDIKE